MKFRIKKLIYVSSVHAIPEKHHRECLSEVDQFNPDDVFGYYAKTKAEASAYVLDAIHKGLKANIIHPSGICGVISYQMSTIVSKLFLTHFIQ